MYSYCGEMMSFLFVLEEFLPSFFGIVKTLEALKTQIFFTATVSPQVDVELPCHLFRFSANCA